MVLHDSVVCANGSAGAGTPEAWRNGILHGFDGGIGAIMIGTEEQSVARGLIIDPGGGASTYMYGGEGKIFYPKIEQDPGGKIIKVHTAEEWRGGNSLKRKRTNHEEG